MIKIHMILWTYDHLNFSFDYKDFANFDNVLFYNNEEFFWTIWIGD